MLFFRVHAEGDRLAGPYQASWSTFRNELVDELCVHSASNKRPSPHTDDELATRFWAKYGSSPSTAYCGFDSIDAALQWFPPRVLELLAAEGFTLHAYDVPTSKVIVSRETGQAMIHKEVLEMADPVVQTDQERKDKYVPIGRKG